MSRSGAVTVDVLENFSGRDVRVRSVAWRTSRCAFDNIRPALSHNVVNISAALAACSKWHDKHLACIINLFFRDLGNTNSIFSIVVQNWKLKFHAV